MNDIIDALLLRSMHHYRAHIHFDPKVLNSRQRACDLLTPGSPFT